MEMGCPAARFSKEASGGDVQTSRRGRMDRSCVWRDGCEDLEVITSIFFRYFFTDSTTPPRRRKGAESPCLFSNFRRDPHPKVARVET